MKNIAASLFALILVVALSACDDDDNGNPHKKKGKSHLDGDGPELAEALPPEYIEKYCLQKWDMFRFSFRVGERLRYSITYDGQKHDVDVVTDLTNKDQVINTWVQTNRVTFMDECKHGKTPDQDIPGIDGEGQERITVPAGTFDTQWRRVIDRDANREIDMTRHSILRRGRLILIRERTKTTYIRPEGLETHTEHKELTVFEP